MSTRIIALFLLTVLTLSAAAKKNSATARGENEDLILNVTIYIDGEGAKEVIGDDLGGHYIVALVKVEPKYGKDIIIDRDDFQLRTAKDGEKTKPLAPSQIAGRGALVLTRTEGPGGLGAEPTRGWSLGGIGMGAGGGGVGSSGEGDKGAVK